jgi:hypothetical protein
MRDRKLVSLTMSGVLLLLMALAAPVAGASPFLEAGQDKGKSAWADSWVCDQGVCEFTFVTAFTGRSSYNGDRFRGDRLCMWRGTGTYDATEHTWTDVLESGCSTSASLSFATSLASASGQATIETETFTCVYDEDTDTEECTDPEPGGEVVVNVQWTATGTLAKGSFRERYQDGDCTWTYSGKGTWREAAAEGSIAGESVSFDYGSIRDGQSKFTYRCH